jgi:DNA repair protein RadC
MNTISLPVYDLRLVRARKPLRLAESEATYPARAARALHDLIGRTDREHLACLFVDARLAIQGAHIIGIGGTSGIVTVEPSCVFRAALVARASSIILGHNHPSGFPQPSEDDLKTTTRLIEAGKVVGVSIVDHLIVTPRPAVFASMRDLGLPSDAWIAPARKEDGH